MYQDFPDGSVVKSLHAKVRDAGDWGSIPDLGSRKLQPTPAFLPGKFHGQSSLAGYNPWGLKESNTTVTEHTQVINW